VVDFVAESADADVGADSDEAAGLVEESEAAGFASPLGAAFVSEGLVSEELAADFGA
jgi:hypothetical protein